MVITDKIIHSPQATSHM